MPSKNIAFRAVFSFPSWADRRLLFCAWRFGCECAEVKKWKRDFEIVAGTGMVSQDGCHIRIALSDMEGNVIGGHLNNGCKVKYTAEVVIGICDDVVYTRKMDEETGFLELNIKTRIDASDILLV